MAMDSDIQGIEKLTWVTKEQLNRLKATAIIYRFNSNIGFKVVSVTSDQIIIRAYQGYVQVGNYCTRKELVRLGRELFDEVRGGRVMHIGPVPFTAKSIVLDGWISVEDRLPQKGDRIIVLYGGSPFIAGYGGPFTDDPEFYDDELNTIHPTHWLPYTVKLPEK